MFWGWSRTAAASSRALAALDFSTPAVAVTKRVTNSVNDFRNLSDATKNYRFIISALANCLKNRQSDETGLNNKENSAAAPNFPPELSTDSVDSFSLALGSRKVQRGRESDGHGRGPTIDTNDDRLRRGGRRRGGAAPTGHAVIRDYLRSARRRARRLPHARCQGRGALRRQGAQPARRGSSTYAKPVGPSARASRE